MSGTQGTAFVITHEADPARKQKSISLIALALTRSLGRQGIAVVRVHPNHLDHSLSSRYCSEIAISPDMYKSPTALVDFLLRLARKYEGKRVLIPASDDCAQFLGEYRRNLETAYLICAADTNVSALVMNKRRQYESAQKLGISIPETYFPETQEEVETLSKEITNYPYVIKPLVAHTWRLASMQSVSKGRKAVLVKSGEELLRAYRAMGSAGRQVMLQEVIGGKDQELFTFLGYLDRNSVPLAYCVRSKVRQFPADFGYCTMTVSCHNDSIVDQSIRLLQGIGFSGICGVEYKFDAATKQYKLIEINARPVNTIGLAPACGVDIPYLAFRDLMGERIQPVTDWRDGVVWYRLWVDFLAVRQLRRSGGPTYLEWWRSIRSNGVEAAYAADDRRPAFGHYGEILADEIRSRIPRSFKSTSPVAAKS